MFVDASAIVAIIGGEAEKLELRAKLQDAPVTLLSALCIYEASLGLARQTQGMLADSIELVDDFVKETSATVVPIDGEIAKLALNAHIRFGKGRHRAALNMGDCFAYACAKSRNVPLLFKGDDFIHTDIEIA
jgi:ribonuclease VapC